ncbi:hypothetical protein ACHAXT_001811 [Thalassiosira profunda]
MTTASLRRYIIARHGETDFNRDRRVQGTNDAAVLTDDGRALAKRLGDYIARRQAGEAQDDIAGDDGTIATAPAITSTWCSPMTRTRQTFAAIAERCFNSHPMHRSLPEPTIHDDLREIELKEWQGRLRKEIMEEDAHNWNIFKKDPKGLRLDGGKFAPVLDCWERGETNWEAIRSDAASTNTANGGDAGAIFIMTHGALGQCMLLSALGIDIESYGRTRKFAFDNCECVEIEWADGEKLCRRWRRVHPKETGWESSETSRRMTSGGLSCGR